MKQLSHIKIPLIAAAFCVGAIAAAAVLWLRIETLGHALRENMQIIVDEQTVENEYLALQSVLAETADERSELGTYVLHDNDDAVTFLSSLDEAAAALGVTLSTEKLDLAETAEHPLFDTLRAEFVLEGAESRVMDMLTLLENVPLHSDMRSLVFERTVDAATGAVQTQARVELTISMVRNTET